MKKSRMTISIDPAAEKMLREAADKENLSPSAMAEKAIRLVCGDYAPHRIDISLLAKSLYSVSVERRGRLFYGLRTLRRHVLGGGVEAAVIIDVDGPIRIDRAVAFLRKLALPEKIRSGEPIRVTHESLTVSIEAFPRMNANHDAIRGLLERAAAVVQDLEMVSLREVSLHKCPECGIYMISKQVWAPANGPRAVEWVCHLGHRSAGQVTVEA